VSDKRSAVIAISLTFQIEEKRGKRATVQEKMHKHTLSFDYDVKYALNLTVLVGLLQ